MPQIPLHGMFATIIHEVKTDEKTPDGNGVPLERIEKIMRPMSYNITSATQKEMEFIDNRLGEFNLSQVPATHEPTLILKNYVIKDGKKISAGIKACVYHWGILYIGQNSRRR